MLQKPTKRSFKKERMINRFMCQGESGLKINHCLGKWEGMEGMENGSFKRLGRAAARLQ